jgi:hypothetical protein
VRDELAIKYADTFDYSMYSPRDTAVDAFSAGYSARDSEVSTLKQQLEVAVGALNKLKLGWLYTPAERQVVDQPTRYDSKNLNEIEEMAIEALSEIEKLKGVVKWNQVDLKAVKVEQALSAIEHHAPESHGVTKEKGD